MLRRAAGARRAGGGPRARRGPARRARRSPPTSTRWPARSPTRSACSRRWADAGGDSAEGEARHHLRALGIDEADLRRPTRELSGGQRKLVALAACLARRPDVLLLDEPEAHLDMRRREQLEAMIRDFDGAVVMVSHDRYLLDECVEAIAELDRGRVRMWPGAYSAYTVARRLELERRQERYVAQQKEIARLEEAVRRFKHWAHIRVNERARQAGARQADADRPHGQDRAAGLRAPPDGARAAQRRGAAASGSSRWRASTSPSATSPCCSTSSWRSTAASASAWSGPNGAGKSVLLRLLAGDLAPSAGTRVAGPVDRRGLPLPGRRRASRAGATVIEAVRTGRSMSEEIAVRRLMRFLFDYEQARRPVASLSGGERTRLALLLLMEDGANCLVLDEPTNHLDIDSIEVLEDALERYDGTVVAVSHDRYFLDRIADRIVLVRDGEVRGYEGGWSANARRCAAA